MTREFEIVLFGATGFTGRLTAAHLIAQHMQNSPEPLRLALAGRDLAKLTSLRSELAQQWPIAEQIPLLKADAFDAQALAEVVARTKVIITTVGPYAKYGLPLVEACARAGTHYVDLTGEVNFMHKTIASYDALAKASGARILHTCGYDSIPSDLGTWVAVRAYKERFGTLPDKVVHAAGESLGGVSGGTVASMLEMFEELAQDPSLGRVLVDPYSLVQGERGLDRRDQMHVRYDRALGLWTAPFVMAPVNSKVVRRSLSLQDQDGLKGAARVSYDECMSTGRGARGLAQATLVTGILGLGTLAMTNGPIRRLARDKFFPKPGSGPSESLRERGFFVSRLRASGPEGEVRLKIRGEGDPGYAATSRMLAESALCLARDPIQGPAGVRTPASTIAEPLLERLKKQKISFELN